MNKIIKEDMDNLVNSCPYEEEFKDKTILITGATGLIARNLTYFFLELNKQKHTNTKVVALVRNMDKARDAFSDYLEDSSLEFMNQDVCEKLEYAGNVDYIFHAAGSASATAIKKNPVGIIKANTIGTMNVLELATEKGSKVIFPSTREIYGKVDGVEKITESDMGIIDPLNGRNCYPESKRLAEALFRSYYEQYGVPFNVLRIAHTYGPTMEINNDGRVMSDFIGDVVNDRDIVLNSDGTAIRAFCYVADTVTGIVEVMVNGENTEAYNLANETEPYMIRDVAQKLVDLYPEKGLKVVFSNPSDEVKKGYVSYKIVKLDTSKLESLGWSPKVELEDEVLEQIRKQLSKLVDVKDIIELKDGASVCRELILCKVAVDAAQRQQVIAVADIFRAKIVDVAEDSMMIELTGNQQKLDAFVGLLNGFEIKELVRTGITGLTRGHADMLAGELE